MTPSTWPARLLPRSLRARLTIGLVVLLALSCAAVGAAAVFALKGNLTHQVDRQLDAAGTSFARSLGGPVGTSDNADERESETDGDEDTRHQMPGTFGARLTDDSARAARVEASSVSDVRLSPDDLAALHALPVDGPPAEIDLSSLGEYRMRAYPGDEGVLLVTGLPLADVKRTTERLLMVEAIVFGLALLVTGIAGAVWVRASLRPLSRVAATAREVSALPLERGEVALAARVPDVDPRTEVGQVGAALNRMLGHVEQALARRERSEQRLRQFAADASHELRTPVASVRGHAELALHESAQVPPTVRRSLERIEAESVRMGEIVDELLLLARLDAGRPLVRAPVDLSRLVLDATEDARAAAADHRWQLDLPDAPVVVQGDASRLHQVLTNLLTNARVHTPAGTTVTVTVRERGDGARLEVADDGPGIPSALQESVFERFTRGPGSRSGSGGGAGLGLSIVAAVVEAHDGSVEVESSPGRTVVAVNLPNTPASPTPPPDGGLTARRGPVPQLGQGPGSDPTPQR